MRIYSPKGMTTALIVAFAIGGFILPRTTHAATSGDVLVNEFVTAPSGSGLEWYEVLNSTASPIDLSTWSIRRQVTADTITLSGTLPAYGILVFTATSTATNDAGDMISLYDAVTGGTLIASVTYGTVSSPSPFVPHASAPGTDLSATAAISTTFIPPTITYTVGTATKGWFNNATAFTCDQLTGSTTPTSIPTLSSIATCLTSQSEVATNMGTLDNPSAAVNLYFEKSISGSPVGRITFLGPLNLTDLVTVSYLQAIGQKMEALAANGDVKIGLDTSVTSNFSGIAGAIIMYNVPGTTAPDLIVKNNSGDIIPPGSADYPTITPGTFDATAHTYSFDTSHFTSFETNTSGLVANTKPTLKTLATAKGAYSFKVGTTKVNLKPFPKYTGKIWARKISLGGTTGTTYLFANLDAFNKGAIKAYDQTGKLLGTYKPFTGFATKGLVVDIAVNANTNTAYVAVGAPNSKTVRIYRVTSKGLTLVNSVSAFKKNGVVVVKFSKIYNPNYGLLTYIRGAKSTLKIWKYNTTTNKFAEDKSYSKSKISVK